jgi:hypothetical protein
MTTLDRIADVCPRCRTIEGEIYRIALVQNFPLGLLLRKGAYYMPSWGFGPSGPFWQGQMSLRGNLSFLRLLWGLRTTMVGYGRALFLWITALAFLGYICYTYTYAPL